MKNRLDSDSRTAQRTLADVGVIPEQKIIDAVNLIYEIEIPVEDLPSKMKGSSHKICVKKFMGVKSV